MKTQCYHFVMVQIPRKWRARGFNLNYKLAALVALAGIGGAASFGMASGQITAAPGSLLAAVFNILSPKPAIHIKMDATSPTTATAASNQALAKFQVSAVNTTNWATIKTLEFEVAISDPNTSSPLNLSDFKVHYNYCVPLGKTYGYGSKGGSCGDSESGISESNHPNIQIVSTTKLTSPDGSYLNAYRIVVSLYQPVYPQQTPGMLTIYATPKYSGTGSSVSKLRVALVAGSATGDQCSKYDSSVSSWAYSGCSTKQTFISMPAYGNIVAVSRSTTPPPTTGSISATFVSASETVTAGAPGGNDDDTATFEIQYNVKAIGKTAYISPSTAVVLSSPPMHGATSVIRKIDGVSVPSGVSVTLTSKAALNASGLYEIPANTEVGFIIKATVKNSNADPNYDGYHQLQLSGISWTNNATDVTPDNSYTSLKGFETDLVFVN